MVVMERSSTNSFMRYCDSSRQSLFQFLEKTNNNFAISSEVFDMIRRQDDFVMDMIKAECGIRTEPLTSSNTAFSSNQTDWPNELAHTQPQPEGPSVRQYHSVGGNDDIQNQGVLNSQYSRVVNNTIPTGNTPNQGTTSSRQGNDSFSRIIQTMATNTLLPALTNFLDRTTAISNPTRGLTQDEIDEATTEICYNEIENPTNRECPITQEEFNEHESVIMLQCGHIYKRDKILHWFTQGTYCPLCRIPLTTREHGNVGDPMTVYVGITLEDEQDGES